MLTDIFFDGRILLLGQVNLLFFVEQDVAAVIFDYLCPDVVTGSILRGVHVSDKADDRFVLLALGGRDTAVDIALVIHKGVGNADFLHLLHQVGSQHLLACGGWNGFGCVVGLGAKADIVQQSFVCAHKMIPPFFLNVPLL